MTRLLSPRNLLRLLTEWALGCVGVLGAILCLTTTFHVPTPGAIYVLVPVLMLLVCTLATLRRGDIFCSVVGCLLLVVMLVFQKPLRHSAVNLWNILAWNYAQGYERLKDYYPPDMELHYGGTTAILLFLAALETFFTGLSLSRWRRTWPVALTLSLGILPCFILTNTLPGLVPLLMVVGSILIQVLSQNPRRREPRDTGRAVLWGAVVSALLIGGLLLAFPRETYEPPITWRQLTEKLENWQAKLDNRGNEAAGLTGNPDDVVLRELRSLPNHPMEVMQIRTDYRGRLYLRGSAYDSYDGRKWTRTESGSWDLAAAYPALGSAASPSYFMKITPITGESLYYTTYELLTLPEGAELVGDAYLKNSDTDETYSFTFSPDAISVPAADAYRRYVESACLELPDAETKQALRAWCAEHLGEGSLQLPVPNRAELISDAVSRAVEYSRNASVPPAGADFALWFLNDAETGYCVHFATTAAALLRAVDIPSRYVSGFICSPGSDGFVKVTTLQAHAWVEYFYEGRWHRLEPTPGTATEFSGSTTPWVRPQPVSEETEATETVEITEITEATEEPIEVTLPEESTEPFVKPTRPTDVPDPSEETTLPAEPTEPKAPSRPKEPWHMPLWGWILLGIAGLIGLILLRRQLASRARDRKLQRLQGNEQALWIYRRYRKLRRRLGEAPEPEAQRLAKKACFSQHDLDPEEMAYLRQCLDRSVSDLRAAGFWKGLYYRFVLAII